MEEFHIILGTPGSGRREIVAQLLDGLHGETRVYIARSEKRDASEDALAKTGDVEIVEWFTDGDQLEIPDADDAPPRIVFITEGARNPVDQLEILAALGPKLGWNVTRVITVVDCALAHREPELAEWYKACIHFSDVVLFNRREGVPPAFDRDFMEPYLKACAPALFEKTKKGRVANPDLVLAPETRRLTQVFDTDRDAIYDLELDEENLPEEPFDLTHKTDPYFERDDRGNRVIRFGHQGLPEMNSDERPLALVTNDDGIGCRFLHELVAALAPRFRVVVAAPAGEQSWIGRAFSRNREVRTVLSEVRARRSPGPSTAHPRTA